MCGSIPPFFPSVFMAWCVIKHGYFIIYLHCRKWNWSTSSLKFQLEDCQHPKCDICSSPALVCKSRLILPWRWSRYVPPKSRLTSNGLHGIVPEDKTLHNHRCKNLKSYPILTLCIVYVALLMAIKYAEGDTAFSSIIYTLMLRQHATIHFYFSSSQHVSTLTGHHQVFSLC
jgi:hypothetical protein